MAPRRTALLLAIVLALFFASVAVNSAATDTTTTTRKRSPDGGPANSWADQVKAAAAAKDPTSAEARADEPTPTERRPKTGTGRVSPTGGPWTDENFPTSGRPHHWPTRDPAAAGTGQPGRRGGNGKARGAARRHAEAKRGEGAQPPV